MTAKLFSLSNLVQHRLSDPHNESQRYRYLVSDNNWFQITTTGWFSMNTGIDIYHEDEWCKLPKISCARFWIVYTALCSFARTTQRVWRQTTFSGPTFLLVFLELASRSSSPWIFCLSSQDEWTRWKFQSRVILVIIRIISNNFE